MGRDAEEPRAAEGAAVERVRARGSGAGEREKRKREEATDPCAEEAESRRKKNRSERSNLGIDGLLSDASREYAVEDDGGEVGEAPDRGVKDRGKNKKLDRPTGSNSPVGELSRSRKKKKKNAGCGADAIDARLSASRIEEDNLNSLETGAEKKEEEKKKDEEKKEKKEREKKKKAGHRADADAIGAGPSAPRGEEDNLNSLETGGKKKKEEKKKDEEKKEKKEREKKKKAGHRADADAIGAGPSAPRGEDHNLNSLETGAEKKEKKRKKKEKEKEKKAGHQADADAIDAGLSAPRGEEDNLNSLETGAEKKKEKKRKQKEKEKEEEKKKEKEKKKKVRFSDHNDIHYMPGSAEDSGDEVKLVVGKRYSEEENQILRDAIAQYLKRRGLREDDMHMLFNVKKHPEVHGCWNEIQTALPWRASNSLYKHADLLRHQSQKRSWTAEEIELIKQFREEHGKGCRWQGLSEDLGRHRHHIKDAWRRNRLPNVKRGKWSQEEYQQLFDLVNLDLRMKSFTKVESKNEMLKQNISWEAISDKLATRHHVMCCSKWYYQLASPMVAKGLWKDTDDYLLLDALSELDASCTEDVDWDSLVGNRSGEVCRQRWKEMIKHIVGKKERSFAEQVEILSRRYCPDMIQYMAEGAKTQ